MGCLRRRGGPLSTWAAGGKAGGKGAQADVGLDFPPSVTFVLVLPLPLR